MSESRLDAAEAAHIVLREAEALSRAARRAVAAADLLERAAASFARGFVAGRPPDGADLLSGAGRAREAMEAATGALLGAEDGLDSLRFVFTDEAEAPERLRQRALDELREHLHHRREGTCPGRTEGRTP